MKKLSDYKDEEAIELWADLFEPFSAILADQTIKKIIADNLPMIDLTKGILKNKPKEVVQILKVIDNDEVTGANAFMRLMSLLTDLMNSSEGRDFFVSAAQETAEHSGSVMENTEDKEI